MEKENVNVGNKKRVVIPESRNRGSSTHPPFYNETTNDKRGRFPLTTCGNDANFISRCFNGGGFTPALVIPVLAVRAHAGYSAGYKSGFTLIELLVVVLIIGILASVALPQYNKVVEKSRATQALTMLKTVYDAAKAYQLANGEWPTSFDELAVDIPWTGNQNGIALGEHRQGKSNADWSIQIRNSGNGAIARGIAVSRISGPYAGATFYLFAATHMPQLSPDELLCIENRGSALSPFNKTKGDYCKKIMKAEPIHTSADGWWDYFRMP